jgi:hypothetical protein
MRTEWIPVSASALVVGAMALVFGSLLNPANDANSTAETLQAVNQQGGRWLGMAVMFFCASVAMTLGLPAILSLFTRRARKLGILGVAVFSVGVIGTCGYAMLLVFFRALVQVDALRAAALNSVAHDKGFAVFLYGWIVGFYLGLLLIAIALFVAKKTPRWVPTVLVLFVLGLPLSSHLGRVGQAIQILALAVAFTGVAVAAVSAEHRTELDRETVY